MRLIDEDYFVSVGVIYFEFVFFHSYEWINFIFDFLKKQLYYMYFDDREMEIFQWTDSTGFRVLR